MTRSLPEAVLQDLVDRSHIQQVMTRYARGVDRSDWDLVRSTYHPDAYDDHGEYKGDLEGLIGWLKTRFAGAENGNHFLGNCDIEFAGPDTALVETYFITQRIIDQLRTGGSGNTAQCRTSWGRYVDRFERRNATWKVAHRIVVMDSLLFGPMQVAPRIGPDVWSRRDRNDHIYKARAEVFGPKS